MEIKMGTRSLDGNISSMETKVIHTGNRTPIQMTVTKVGMEQFITEKKEEKHESIEINKLKCIELLKLCAEDLSNPRKIIINGLEEIVNIISLFDSRNLIFSFTKDIAYINEAFKVNEKDLSDFLSNFFFTNINTYCWNLYNAYPSLLPMISVESVQGNRVIVNIH